MSKSHVLDASAVLDFVEGGPGGKRVEQLFKDALGKRSRVLMSVVNWGEVFYHSWQQHGEVSARRL
jgi:PIN domain nuclease of toxin-antitoxin system